MNASRPNPILVIIKNIGALTVARMVGRVFNFILVAVVARKTGTDGLGGYATAQAIAAFALILADIGLSPRLVREASADRARADVLFAESMGVKVATSAIVIGILAVLFWVLPYEPWVRELTLLFSIAWLIRSYTQLNHSIIRARERMELEAISSITMNVCLIVTALGALELGYPIVALGWAAIASAFVQLVVSTLIARRFCHLGMTSRISWSSIRSAAPYTATLVTNAAFSQSHVIVISLVAAQTLVGEFSSVYRILILATVAPQLISLAIMPSSARVFAQSDPARFRRLTTGSLRLLQLIAGGAAVALVSLSSLLLELIYGPEIQPLYPYLQLGTLYLVLQFASKTMGTSLTASGRQGARARAIVIALVTSLALFVILTPLWGLVGAIAALILAELTLVGVEYVAMHDLIDRADLFRNLAVVTFSGSAAVASHFALAAYGHTWLALGLPIFLYVALLVPTSEPQRVLEMLRTRR